MRKRNDKSEEELFDELHKAFSSMLDFLIEHGEKSAEVMKTRQEVLELLKDDRLMDSFQKAMIKDNKKELEKHLDFYMQLKYETINFIKEVKA